MTAKNILIGADAAAIVQTLYQLKAEQDGRDVVITATDITDDAAEQEAKSA